MTVTEHTATSGRHTTFYLAAGPEDGPLLIFVHGWPELSISWRQAGLASQNASNGSDSTDDRKPFFFESSLS